MTEEKTPHGAVVAMVILLDSVPEGRERGYVMESLIGLVWRMWHWNVETFRDELELARASLRGTSHK